MQSHPSAAPQPADRTFFGHPRGLSTLFFTEMWERFSYYGMRAILILFMTATVAEGGLGFSKDEAGGIYGLYTSMVYLLPLAGGWLADKLLGQRRAVLLGAIVIMAGHICLAIHGISFFYAGLGLVVIGTGLLKPNISAIVGQIYSPEDQRRDSGFSIFYMGINVGAFLSPLVCGWLAQSRSFRDTLQGWGIDPANSWHWGFGAAAVGMFFGIVQYVLTGKHLGQAGLEPPGARTSEERAQAKSKLQLAAVVTAAVIGGLTALALFAPGVLTKERISGGYMVVLVAAVVGFFAWLLASRGFSRGERAKLTVVLMLFLGSCVFWSVFEQAGSTLNVFADEATHNVVGSYAFPSSWWQSVNAFLLVLLAPAFAWLWSRIGRLDPTSMIRFAVGVLFVGLGFLYLVGGARGYDALWQEYTLTHGQTLLDAAGGLGVDVGETLKVPAARAVLAAAGEQGVDLGVPAWTGVSFQWLLVVYLLHTLGELCLSPVGLSSMTKFGPPRIAGLMLGVWFASISVGSFLGGEVASVYEKFELPTLIGVVGASAVAMAIVMAILVAPAKRLMAREQ